MNTDTLASLTTLSDRALLAAVQRLAADERRATVSLIAHLAELDRRRLYLAEGYPSLFSYCTQALRLSEHAAYHRIEAARAARRFPLLLEQLAEGAITLTTVGLLARLLTPENHRAVLTEARHRSKLEVEELVARLRPRPDAPALIRPLPPPRPASSEVVESTTPDGHAAPGMAAAAAAQGGIELGLDRPPADSRPAGEPGGRPAPPLPPSQRTVITPLAPRRYKIQFTMDAATLEKLRMAQALLRHQLPTGDVPAIIDRALTLLLEELLRQKAAATARPRPAAGQPPRAGVGVEAGADAGARAAQRTEPGPRAPSRYIPAEVRRAVWRRDGGRCAFVAVDGRRCPERSFLEFHHVVPYSRGGAATVANIELRCRAHNGYEADLAQVGRRPAARAAGTAHVDGVEQMGGGPRTAENYRTELGLDRVAFGISLGGPAQGSLRGPNGGSGARRSDGTAPVPPGPSPG